MCLTQISTFDSEYSFNHCRRRMMSYKDEVADFLKCVDRARSPGEEAIADAMIYNALDDLDRAFKYWNCRARGNTYCPGL